MSKIIFLEENQPVGWLGGWWYLQPIRVQISDLTLVFLIKSEYFSVEGHVPVDNETLMVTSSISRPDPPAQSIGGAHRGKICMRTFILVDVCACM